MGKKVSFFLTMEDENSIFLLFFRYKIIIFPNLMIKIIILLFPQLMVIGLHGDSTANVLRLVEEAHSIEREPAITQHPLVEANIVLDHLSNQSRAIPKGVLVNPYTYILIYSFS